MNDGAAELSDEGRAGVPRAGPYRRALVLGLGLSGEAAAALLLGERTAVTAVDTRHDEAVAARARRLSQAGAQVLVGSDKLPAEGDFDVCIVSPGLRLDHPWPLAVRERGIPLLSELALGAARCACPMLAVTGSNGKSTMVKLCAESLGRAGRRVSLAGNYGTPLCRLVPETENLDWMVVEVSSFQLEASTGFRPRVGVLLNVQPDHLDRHGDMEAYTRVKASLFAGMQDGDCGIVREVERERIAAMARGGSRWTTFGVSEAADYRYADGRVSCRSRPGGAESVDVSGTVLANPILGLTVAAAVAAIEACGVDPRCVAVAARHFEPLPHRMKEVVRLRGVRFVDDSKATNLSAMRAALVMCRGPVLLIAGGLLKEKKLESAKEVLASRARRVYLIGDAAEAMASAWGDTVVCRICGDLDGAVRAAWADAQPGDTVLLSPGCASFDQFGSFEQRGNRFATIAGALHEDG